MNWIQEMKRNQIWIIHESSNKTDYFNQRRSLYDKVGWNSEILRWIESNDLNVNATYFPNEESDGTGRFQYEWREWNELIVNWRLNDCSVLWWSALCSLPSWVSTNVPLKRGNKNPRRRTFYIHTNTHTHTHTHTNLSRKKSKLQRNCKESILCITVIHNIDSLEELTLDIKKNIVQEL